MQIVDGVASAGRASSTDSVPPETTTEQRTTVTESANAKKKASRKQATIEERQSQPRGDDPGRVEERLWNSADQLRANSTYASNEYFLPVMGLIFLRHAYNRFLKADAEIRESLPSRGGKTREPTKEDFSRRGAILLRPETQFEYLVNRPEGEDLAAALVHAMDSIEKDHPQLQGVLPKSEYKELDNDVLRQLLRTFNDPVLQQANGDVFGRIYEYFLTKFADLAAHDGGEFFTPMSLVQMIVNVIEPDHGTVLDPACGSGGMFVQSAHFIEGERANPSERATFYGMEKNQTTIRLAQMNLAVHGLEGSIQKAITYYEDPHKLLGQADFVMANPPFNVDEVDAEKIENDRRLPFGLPGVNKKGKVSNGNYLWISYFYSYLNERGRAGFVMSSQASSAGGQEAQVRRRLVETGDVDAMIAIRANFFYTRSVPCELWFLNRDKPAEHRDKVLMIDARNTYRKVTRKIYDFTPEQLKNLTSIVWLYRGETDRFLGLVAEYLAQSLDEARAAGEPLQRFLQSVDGLLDRMQPFLDTLAPDGPQTEPLNEFREARRVFADDIGHYRAEAARLRDAWADLGRGNAALHDTAARVEPVAEQSRDLIKQADQLAKLAGRVADVCEQELGARQDDRWPNRDISRRRKAVEEARKAAVHQLGQVRYFYRQAHWLQGRFPDAALADVEGLVKLVSTEAIEANDWSLTPGRYVGVAPDEPDEDFDFEEALRLIHQELAELDETSQQLSRAIRSNLMELGA